MYSKTLHFFHPVAKNNFLATMLRCNKSNLDKIYQHPFNQQLFNGTLCDVVFGQYLRDDYFYLHHFSRVIKKLAQRSVTINPDLAQQLTYLSTSIIDGEQDMLSQYSQHFVMRSSTVPGSAINKYIDFLSTNTEHLKLPVALSGILPCFWIYYQLGTQPIHPMQLEVNPYKRWIATYTSPHFINATTQLADTVNQVGEQASGHLQLKMHNAFATAVEFELQFFDQAFYSPLKPPVHSTAKFSFK